MAHPKDTKARRPAPLSVRFSKDERQRLEVQAGGMPLAAYIKALVFAEDAPRYRKRRRAPGRDQTKLAEILARLGASRVASNLNQIAKAIHCGTLIVDPDLEAELNRACAEVAWIRATLVEALGLGKAQKPEPDILLLDDPITEPEGRA